MAIVPIENPHLPTGKVRHILCGALPDAIKKQFAYRKIELLSAYPEPYIEKSLQRHADLSVCPIPNKAIVLSPSQIFLKEKLISVGFCVIMTNNEPNTPYPNDCILNYIQTNDYLIYNSRISNVISFNSIKHAISVHQGYIKCSVAPVAKNAILTDDIGIAEACKKNGLDVCLVRKGSVQLDGYPYGFIGGSCGKISKNEMAFCGNIDLHIDAHKIKNFLNQYGVQAVSLSDSPLMDVGSLLPLTHEKEVELHEEKC